MQFMHSDHSLRFEKQTIGAKFISPSGEKVEKRIEIRINPISERTSRIALGRSDEKDPRTERLPLPPPNANDAANCAFCRPQVTLKTPEIDSDIFPSGRLRYNNSISFPNLFRYGRYSAVSLFDDKHFVEMGRSSLFTYSDCFMNCRNYLSLILNYEPEAIYMSIRQNHLPSAGGSMIHPHLQINADSIASNHHRFLRKRAEEYFNKNGSYIFSDYLSHERKDGSRHIGKTVHGNG